MLNFGKKVNLLGTYEAKNRKTRRLIEQSFLKILETKSFEKITIGDITKTAGINRGTFYLHYLDKYDLLDKIEHQLFVELANLIDELQFSYLTFQEFERNEEQIATNLFSFFKRQAPVMKVLLSDHGGGGFHLRFRDEFTNKVRANLGEYEHFTANLSVPMDYFLSFIIAAFLGLIEQWFQNDLDKTPQEMTSLYIEIISFIKKQ